MPKSWKIRCRKTAAASTCKVIPNIIAVRNHIIDFLVTRSKTFTAEVPDHDPRDVPLVRIGRTEPAIIPVPKAVDTAAAQAIAQ